MSKTEWDGAEDPEIKKNGYAPPYPPGNSPISSHTQVMTS